LCKGLAQAEAVEPQAGKAKDITPEERRRHWQDHIDQWQSSGLTQKEYCRRNGFNWSTFHYWRKRLQEKTNAVTLVQVPVRKNIGVSSGRELTLILTDRYKVYIGDNFNPSTLAKLVDTLERL
jgi:hypothetical protein